MGKHIVIVLACKSTDVISCSQPRESTTASGISWGELAEARNVGNNDSSDRGDTSSLEWLNDNLHVDFTSNENKRKPSDASWGALCDLNSEVFRNPKESRNIRESAESCSICLESFDEGDGLIRLHCGHRFHPTCLQPWVQTCRRCPYCRANIPCL